jgi:hypothetical protein
MPYMNSIEGIADFEQERPYGHQQMAAIIF